MRDLRFAGGAISIRGGELYHHGILGQKWGVRNGPPYPLSPEKHSKSEKSAGYQKSIDGMSSNDRIKSRKFSISGDRKKGLSDSQKRALKIGAAVAVTCLAGYGLYKSGALSNFKRNGVPDLSDSDWADTRIEDIQAQVNATMSKLNQVHSRDMATSRLKDDIVSRAKDISATQGRGKAPSRIAKETVEQVLKTANSDWDGRSGNCGGSAISGVARMLGFNTTAKNFDGMSVARVMSDCFDLRDNEHIDLRSGSPTLVKILSDVNEAKAFLVRRFGENAVGTICTGVKGQRYGHVFMWAIENGRVRLFDPKRGYSSELIESHWDAFNVPNYQFSCVTKLSDAFSEGRVNWEALSEYLNLK